MNGLSSRSRSSSVGSPSFQARMNDPMTGETHGGLSDHGLPATYATASMTQAPSSLLECEPDFSDHPSTVCRRLAMASGFLETGIACSLSVIELMFGSPLHHAARFFSRLSMS